MSDNAAPILSREEIGELKMFITAHRALAGTRVNDILYSHEAQREEIQRLTEERDAARLAEMRNYLASPAMATFAELKHSQAGTVLAMLGDGAISRGKCCEVLAQLAHGVPFDEIPLPGEKGRQFSEDEIPAEVVEKLEAELSALRAELVETRDRSNKNHDAALGFQNRALNAESLLASATDLMNTCAREWNVAQAANESGIKDLFDRLWSEMSCRYFDKRDDEAKANQDAVTLRAELEAVKAERDRQYEFNADMIAKYAALEAEHEKARVRLEEAERDTKRLEWLESKWVDDESSPLTEYEGQWHADGMPNGPMTDDMRSAIDAAISQTAQPEEKRES